MQPPSEVTNPRFIRLFGDIGYNNKCVYWSISWIYLDRMGQRAREAFTRVSRRKVNASSLFNTRGCDPTFWDLSMVGFLLSQWLAWELWRMINSGLRVMFFGSTTSSSNNFFSTNLTNSSTAIRPNSFWFWFTVDKEGV